MARFVRPTVALGVALGMVLTATPASAGDGHGTTPHVRGVRALPVAAADVTRSDRSLRRTDNEVVVLSKDEAGRPTVMKLRANSAAQARTLARFLDDQPDIVAAENRRVQALGGALDAETLGPDQWNLLLVGAPTAWETTRGAGVTVAVIDTGVDGTHEDLVGRVLPEIDLLPDVTPLPDDNGHGTSVASIIAGGLNQWGMAGVAPEASILPVAALDPAGWGDSATVAQGIIAAADAGARVINLSLGGPDPDPVLDAACAYAWSRGAILVAAIGNSFHLGNPVQYPAASPDVLGVAAVDGSGNPTYYSNTGPHVDLAAPGELIYGAVPGQLFAQESGTSFAAPHVAGVLALAAAANPTLTAPDLVQLVELTAQDDLSGNGRDDQLGYGIVRADRAVSAAVGLQAQVLGADAPLRLERFNASPEPLRRGRVLTASVLVRAQYPDLMWRDNPTPVRVRFEYKRKGRRHYRLIAEVASGQDGWAQTRATPRRSGRWRARVQLADGTWERSRSDYVKVRRRAGSRG